MQTEVSITVSPKDEKKSSLIRKLILRELRKQKSIQKNTPNKNFAIDEHFEETHKINFVQTKKSIDARHGGLKLHLRYKVFIDEEISEKSEDKLPVWKKTDEKKSVIIVGSGPAGLFGALKLLEYGIKPIIIERGDKTDERKKAIAQISTKQTVDENSNYCFGEGGAGTFSDGKLYTRSNKRGNITRILKIFVNFGADEKILTDAHPHIGTDRLPEIIKNMRYKIEELGGEFHFNMKVVKIGENTKSNAPSKSTANDDAVFSKAQKTVIAENTISHERTTFTADAILLATGHSASDIYKMIAAISPESLEPKTFAVGVRVEHPRKIIDDIQYHKTSRQNKMASKKSSSLHRESGASDNTPHIADSLGAAEYRLTTQVDGRGVYSFCMCPGGFVVPSQTGPDEIVVNGMSNRKRNSAWSNAAIVVETRPEDIPEQFIVEAKKDGCPALAGLYYRRYLEKLAKDNGDGQKAPAQRLVDFLAHRDSEFGGVSKTDSAERKVRGSMLVLAVRQFGGGRITSYTPGIVASRLDKWLPEEIGKRLSIAFKNFDRNMKGFISDDALMIAIETRTSTPVRILRDAESFECVGLEGVFPAGEGSGYSGGIVSSAMDGETVCEMIARRVFEKTETI